MTSFNQRSEERAPVSKTIVYVIDSPIQDKPIDGFIEDISESGFCMFTPYPLRKAEKIKINTDTSLPSHRAVVRWSEQYDDEYCKVGLEFYY